MNVRGVILLGTLLLPPIQARCWSRCNSQVFTCSVSLVTRQECRDVRSAPVTEDQTISFRSHRRYGVRQTDVRWTPREFEGLLSLPGDKKCFKISITKNEEEGGAEDELRVRCADKGGRPRLYHLQGHSASRVVHGGHAHRHSGGGRCRCVTPRRVETRSPGGGRLIVSWWDYDGSSRLNVSIVKQRGHTLVSSTSLDITSVGGHHSAGQVHFDNFSSSPGRYLAVIRPVGCPSECKRESAAFEWPPKEGTAPATSSPRRSRHTCECWTPRTVRQGEMNASLGQVEVEWSGNYSAGDLKVGLVKAGENSVFAAHVTLTAPELKRLTKNSVKLYLTADVSGEYTALVGSVGCSSCMRYRESQSFHWPPSPSPSSVAPPSSTTQDTQNTSYSVTTLTAVVSVLGALSCIIVVAVGITISRKFSWFETNKQGGTPWVSRDSTKETLLPPDSMSLECVSTALLLYPPDDEDLKHAAERLAGELQRLGVSGTLESLKDEVNSHDDVIMNVTLREQMKRVPAQLKRLQDRMVTVGVSFASESDSPFVSVPGNFRYSDVPNNLTQLTDFLKLFRDPVPVKTLVVCGGESDRQLDACRLLIQYIDQPPLQLVFPDTMECRTELMENTDEWFDRQVKDARFIIAIASAEMSSDENSSNLTRFLNMVLNKARDSQEVQKKTVLVSLGDHSNQRTTVQRPYLSSCPSFHLFWNSDKNTPLLLPLVNHLCGGTDILQQACCRSDAKRICGWDQDAVLRDVLRTLCTSEAESSV